MFAPLRLGAEAARLGIRIGIGVARIPLRVLQELIGGGEEPPPAPPRREPAAERPAPARRTPVPPPEPEIELEPEEPSHIDDEPELVAEFAEPGAEDGAGPEIRVDEPWTGYARMKVAEIKRRVADATPAEAAVIQLYESTHRNRRSILDAVERRSRELANSPNGR